MFESIVISWRSRYTDVSDMKGLRLGLWVTRGSASTRISAPCSVWSKCWGGGFRSDCLEGLSGNTESREIDLNAPVSWLRLSGLNDEKLTSSTKKHRRFVMQSLKLTIHGPGPFRLGSGCGISLRAMVRSLV